MNRMLRQGVGASYPSSPPCWRSPKEAMPDVSDVVMWVRHDVANECPAIHRHGYCPFRDRECSNYLRL